MPARLRQSTARFSVNLNPPILQEQRRRKVRSFVLREGRLTRGQARALELHWHDYGIEFSPEPVNLDRVFGRVAPKILEIGSGMGEVLTMLAHRHPENDYLAVEVHRPGVGSLIRQAVEAQLTNIRIIRHDVMEILRLQLREKCLDEIYIFFPDPWPKKRHHKRRLLTVEFVSLLASRMKSHGRLFILTDFEDLAADILEVCDGCEGLFNLAGKDRYAPRPHWLPTTKFESRGKKLGHKIWSLAYSVKRIS